MKKALRDLLAPYRPEVRRLAWKARRLVLDVVLDAYVVVRPNLTPVSFRDDLD
jgi:hypothetical protein